MAFGEFEMAASEELTEANGGGYILAAAGAAGGSYVGTSAGTLAGQYIGSTIGTMICPGLGSVAGYLAGGVILREELSVQ